MRRVKLFSECEPSLLYELVIRFQMKMFAPNDFLCRSGDLAKEMFVLKRGILEILTEEGEVYSQLSKGGIFGEMSILKPIGSLGRLLSRRRYSLRSVEQRKALIKRGISLLIENNEIKPEQLSPTDKFAPLELSGTESVNEIFKLLKGTLDILDTELDSLYVSFADSSSTLKKQMTTLESFYLENRQLFKNTFLTSKRFCRR
ncbi:Cyclic nucleotide-binding domain-containing protein [Meloidogyne graminicola]|uniref:Cyclic nucleotide-binding domain-containing protein n=1 Tax=Meloidogyne graminicola TaxID=189291 RepID=A0A8T0A550_9BILA|nr:Cyclic nucleotide-binding domain-containing protein [Meloidogyne graminicola]